MNFTEFTFLSKQMVEAIIFLIAFPTFFRYGFKWLAYRALGDKENMQPFPYPLAFMYGVMFILLNTFTWAGIIIGLIFIGYKVVKEIKRRKKNVDYWKSM